MLKGAYSLIFVKNLNATAPFCQIDANIEPQQVTAKNLYFISNFNEKTIELSFFWLYYIY